MFEEWQGGHWCGSRGLREGEKDTRSESNEGDQIVWGYLGHKKSLVFTEETGHQWRVLSTVIRFLCLIKIPFILQSPASSCLPLGSFSISPRELKPVSYSHSSMAEAQSSSHQATSSLRLGAIRTYSFIPTAQYIVRHRKSLSICWMNVSLP